MWLLILTLTLLFIFGIVLVPLSFELNSTHNIYRIRLFMYAGARWIRKDIDSYLLIRVLGIPFRVKPLKLFAGRSFRPKKQKSTKLPQRNTFGKGSLMGRKVLRAIRVKKFYLNIDTGNFPLNARLFPVAAYLREQNYRVHINFQGENDIELRATTSLIRILWIMITSSITNKNKNHGK